MYWRFENDVLDSGYPKPIATGFDGLRGHVTAALSVPQYQSRGESVYFFKRGEELHLREVNWPGILLLSVYLFAEMRTII